MKNQILLLLCLLIISASAMAQAAKKSESIKVYGNCDMCKASIEGSLKKKDGIISKRWDPGTLVLTVSYDSTMITIREIGQKIADAGYDNEYVTATDAKYNSLHKCCQYKRPEKN